MGPGDPLGYASFLNRYSRHQPFFENVANIMPYIEDLSYFLHLCLGHQPGGERAKLSSI